MAEPLVALGVNQPNIDPVGNMIDARTATINQHSVDQDTHMRMLDLLAAGAAHAMPDGPNGPVDPAKWNEVISSFEQMGLPPGNVEEMRQHPEYAAAILHSSTKAMAAMQDQAAAPFKIDDLKASIAEHNAQAAKASAPPTVSPTDDQRELAQINEERKAAKKDPLDMETFLAAKHGQGLSVQTNPDGTVSVTQGGAGGKPLTEGQSKDVTFVTRASGALSTLNSIGDKLTSLGEDAANSIPYGKYLQSEDYQRAKQSGDEFISAILRKDSGAAITPDERKQYGDIYLPSPGDKPAVLKQKEAARNRAVKAIAMGLPPAAILSLEQNEVAIPNTADTKNPTPDAGVPTDAEETKVVNGKTYFRKGSDWFEVD